MPKWPHSNHRLPHPRLPSLLTLPVQQLALQLRGSASPLQDHETLRRSGLPGALGKVDWQGESTVHEQSDENVRDCEGQTQDGGRDLR